MRAISSSVGGKTTLKQFLLLRKLTIVLHVVLIPCLFVLAFYHPLLLLYAIPIYLVYPITIYISYKRKGEYQLLYLKVDEDGVKLIAASRNWRDTKEYQRVLSHENIGFEFAYFGSKNSSYFTLWIRDYKNREKYLYREKQNYVGDKHELLLLAKFLHEKCDKARYWWSSKYMKPEWWTDSKPRK